MLQTVLASDSETLMRSLKYGSGLGVAVSSLKRKINDGMVLVVLMFGRPVMVTVQEVKA